MKNEPLVVSGIVIKGSQDGRKIGFPTINIALEKSVFLDLGVYACKVEVKGKLHNGVMHYGPRAVFDETENKFEVHLLDFDEDLYGEKVKVEIYDFLRPTMNFDDIDSLKKQIQQDCLDARKVLE